jgi:hypothetical protein
LNKEHQGDSFQLVKYGNLVAQARQGSCNEHDKEKTNIRDEKSC